MTLHRALLISDEPTYAELSRFLDGLGYDVETRGVGAAALVAASMTRPDLLIVDCRRDESKGLQLCHSFQSEHSTASLPIIVLTLPAQADCRFNAFRAGAHDCLVEPIMSGESLERLRAMKRRLENERSGETVRYADLELNIEKHKVRRNSHLVPLTVLQMRLLRFLMENPERVFTREELLEAVWGNQEVDPGAVTVCIVRLRRALNAHGPDIIRPVPGAGYALDAEIGNSRGALRAAS